MVCLLLAASIWLLIKFSDVYTTEISVSIQWKDTPENLYEIVSPVENVNAVLQATGFILFEEKYLSSSPVARLSMSKASLVHNDRILYYTLNMADFTEDLIRQCGFETRVEGFKPLIIRAEYGLYDTLDVPVEIVFPAKQSGRTLSDLIYTSPAFVKVKGIPSKFKIIQSIKTDTLFTESFMISGIKKLALIPPGNESGLLLLQDSVSVLSRIDSSSQLQGEPYQ